jgi:hypothetical protein
MITLLIVLALLQLGDGLTTYYVISRGGQELNKIMAYLFSKVGMVPALIIKGIFVVIVGWIGGTASIWSLCLLIVMYLAVVGWNLYQIVQMNKG